MSREEIRLVDDPTPQRKSRRDRFMEVAQRRTRNVLEELRKLGNCGNRSAYEYSEADVEKIFDAIERELTVARSRFRTEDRKKVEFTLE